MSRYWFSCPKHLKWDRKIDQRLSENRKELACKKQQIWTIYTRKFVENAKSRQLLQINWERKKLIVKRPWKFQTKIWYSRPKKLIWNNKKR